MNAYWLSVCLTGGALLVGYLIGIRHPINRYDDMRSELSWRREQMGDPQRYTWAESIGDLARRLIGRPQGSGVRPAAPGIWSQPVAGQAQAVRNLNEEVTADA